MRRLLAFAPLLALAATGPAYRYRLDGSRSTVNARVSYLGLGSKTVRFPTMKGSIRIAPDRLEDIDLTVELDPRALTAGSKSDTDRLRGKDFFDVGNHPSVTFSGRRMTMNSPVTARIDGTITARGVSKPAVLAVTFRDPPARATGRDPVQLNATTTIDRRQFGMTAYGWAVGSKVTITIDARMVPG